MAEDMITVDASAMASIDYSQAIYDYFESLGSTAGSSTYYGGTYTQGFGYYEGSQVGFRYSGTQNSAQVLIEGADIAYDGLKNAGHGISGSVDSFTLGYYDSGTTYTQDDTAGTRSELQGVIDGLVVSGLDFSAAVGAGTGSDNLVYQLYNALRKANTVVDLDSDGDSGYEYIDLIYQYLSAKAQHFIGSAGDDSYTGTTYGDLIDGGAGADSLAGGAGDDTYVLDDAGDSVTEAADAGTDTVETTLNHYQIGDNVENLTLTGSDNLFGYGNGLDNTLTGNSGANALYGLDGNDTIDGGTGADTMVGGVGNDVYYMDVREDVVTENADSGTDTIITAISHLQIRANVENIIQTGEAGQFSYGNALDNTMTAVDTGGYLYGMEGADTLNGGAGDDTLDGGTGIDVMTGGAGDDYYGVDDVADVIVEDADQGRDEVGTSLDGYVLGDTLEDLTLLSSTDEETPDADLAGSGNAAGNIIIGNGGANTLYGLAGTDTIYGGEGADVIDGGSEADSMSGGIGDDTYVVENTGDVVTEATGEGTDTVRSSINFTLGNFVENLVLTGSTAIKGMGNALGNTITGNSLANKLYGYEGADSLTGGKGDDRLDGGLGVDALKGGAGADTFVFKADGLSAQTKSTDVISDFRAKQGDLIDLHGLDANENRKGNQDFDFIGKDDFSGHAGELRFQKSGDHTYVLGDNDGDGKADFALDLAGSFNLKEDYFLL